MYFSYIQKLTSICAQRHFRLEVISFVGKRNEYPLFKVTIPGNAHKTVCFSAGIHGDEISGSFAMLKLLKSINFKKQNVPKIILFPVANPTGFHACRERNFQNINLNRHFRNHTFKKENRALYNTMKKENVHCFMALHGDDVNTCAYLHAYIRNEQPILHPRKILTSINRYIPICKKSRIFSMQAYNGLIVQPKPDGSFEERMHHEGIPYSFCLEMPYVYSVASAFSLNRTIQAEVAAMKTVIAEYTKSGQKK